MPTNHTTNYQLSQWVKSDQIRMEDFNADNARIDAAIKAETDARMAQSAALTAALAKLGNCQIETFTYVGNGDAGYERPNRINFTARPVLVLVVSPISLAVVDGAGDVLATVNNYNSGAAFCGSDLAWEGNQLLLYSSVVAAAANVKGTTYRVFAFYAEDKT